MSSSNIGMIRFIFIIILLFIIASFILQMIALLANFNGLKSVYITRIDLGVSNSEDNGIFSSIWDNSKDSILGNVIPEYFTLGLFVLCEGTSSSQTICAPPSFGFDYDTTGTLQLIEEKIPSNAQSIIAKVQKGVFIPSVVLCFILLCYSCFSVCSRREHSMCSYLAITVLSVLAFLFCLASFVIQYIVCDKIRDEINNFKTNFLGGLVNEFVTVTPKSGRSIWISLVAFILLFLVTVMLLFCCCTGKKYRKRRNQPESYEMT